MIEKDIENIRLLIHREKELTKEFSVLFNYLKNTEDKEERRMIKSQINKLKISLKSINTEFLAALEKLTFQRPLTEEEKMEDIMLKRSKTKIIGTRKKEKLSELERLVIERLKKKKIMEYTKKEKKVSFYITLANRLFSSKVRDFIKDRRLFTLEKDLIKSNLGYTIITYISMGLLTTAISVAVALFAFLFFLFFSLTPEMPLIVRTTEGLLNRLLKTFWILFVVPIATGIFMYFYPSMEQKSREMKINQELPFATINMAAISGSMIEPVKVFKIICETKEYPYMEKEFNKLLNEINIYGYDLVTALKDSALNCPSQKLSDLFNGLATTITSGGNLFEFFDKRSQTILFEYKLDREKSTKAAETFMDIYISVVVAAPMILMLLLMLMKISGLGVSLSTSIITLLVVGGVSLINIMFLVFLQVKQPGTA